MLESGLCEPNCSKNYIGAQGEDLLRVKAFLTAAIARGRVSASCAVGQDGCRIYTWPRHTKDVIKMVPVAALLGAQHYKTSTGFSSLKTMRH